MKNTNVPQWEENNVFIDIRFALLSYARQQGFKDHIKYAAEIDMQLKTVIRQTIQEERQRILEKIKIIDYTRTPGGSGGHYYKYWNKYDEKDSKNPKVQIVLEENDKTLKVFIS